MRGKIMKRTVESLKAPATGEVMLWDDGLKGSKRMVSHAAGCGLTGACFAAQAALHWSNRARMPVRFRGNNSSTRLTG